MERELLTIKQLAEHYQVSTRTIERWKEIGLPFIQVGIKLVRYNFKEVDNWIKQHK